MEEHTKRGLTPQEKEKERYPEKRHKFSAAAATNVNNAVVEVSSTAPAATLL